MMIQDYKQEFMLDGACYLNCAYLGPCPSAPFWLGVRAVVERPRLTKSQRDISFPTLTAIREQFAHIVSATPPDSIALFPAVSYGLATIAKNIGNSLGGC